MKKYIDMYEHNSEGDEDDDDAGPNLENESNLDQEGDSAARGNSKDELLDTEEEKRHDYKEAEDPTAGSRSRVFGTLNEFLDASSDEENEEEEDEDGLKDLDDFPDVLDDEEEEEEQEQEEDEDGSDPIRSIKDKRPRSRSSRRKPAKKRPKIGEDFLRGGYLWCLANGIRSGSADKRLVRLRLLVRRDVTYTQLRVALLLLEICSFKKWTKLSAEKVAHELHIAQSHSSKALKEVVAHGLVSRRDEEQAYSYKLIAPKHVARRRRSQRSV